MTIHKSVFQIGPHSLAASLTGPPRGRIFVLIHGIGLSGRYFHPLVAELSQKYRVICLDLPGFGSSSRPKTALTIAQLADVVASLIHQEQWEHPILVGHSMGAQIVAYLLAHQPSLSFKAVLLGPTTNPAERSLPWQALRLLQDTLREPLALNLIAFSEYVRCGLPHYLATARHMVADHLEDHLPLVQAEVLIIRGANDPTAPHDWVVHATALLSHGSLYEIPGAAHVVHFAKAAVIAKLCSKLADRP